MPPPLPRGGLGIAENFSSSPEAPLLGELSSEARLRGCTKGSLTDMPMAPPLGELAGASPTERARPLTANPRHSDSITLTKSLPIAAPTALSCRACPLRHLRCHLSQRERLWQAGSLPTGRLRFDRTQEGGPCLRGQRLLDNAPCQAAAGLDSGALLLPRHCASLVQTKADRHAKGSPFGGAGGRKPD